MPTHTLTLQANTNDTLFARQDIGGRPVRFRKSDAFGNLNDVLEPFDRLPSQYLRLPSTKRFMQGLAEDENLLCKNLTTTQHNGSYRGTYAHPLLVIHAAQYADVRFGIACHKALLRQASKTGKVLENGDVVLRLDAESMEEASSAPTISSTQVQVLLDDVASMRGELAELKKSRDTHRMGLRYLLKARQVQGESSAAMLGDMERADQSAPLALPAAPVFTPDPNVYDASRPSLDRMREIIGERVRAYSKACHQGECKYVGVVWNRLYDQFEQRTGVNTRTRNRYIDRKKYKKGSRIGYVEALGLLPELFELSTMLVG